MPITRIYNTPNNTIRTFNDSDLRQYGLPLVVNNKNISLLCSVNKYSNALTIEHNGGGKHSININWSRVVMSAPVEYFTLTILYGENVRITEQVQVKYSLQQVNIKPSLSISSGTWGKDPNCVLYLKPKFSSSDSWKYSDRKICLTFPKNNELFYLEGHDEKLIFSAKEGISVPLRCKFTDEYITKEKQVNIHFSLDQQSIFIPFKFSPICADLTSFSIDLVRLSDEYQYGSSDKKVFEVVIKSNNRYIPVNKVEFKFSNTNSPFYHKIIDNKHFLFINANKIKWTGGDSSYLCNIIVNDVSFQKEFHLTKNNTKDNNYIKLTLGDSPRVNIRPSDSIELFLEQSTGIGLEIFNPLLSSITINKIKTGNCELCNLSYHNNKNLTIQPNSKITLDLELQANQVGKSQIIITTISNEAKEASAKLDIIVEKKEDPAVSVEFVPREGYDILVQKEYETKEVCGRLIVKHVHDDILTQSFIPKDFKLISSDFTAHSLSDNTEDSHKFEIVINQNSFKVDDIKSLPVSKEDNLLFYHLPWEYHEQKGEVLVPVKKISLYKISLKDKNSVGDINSNITFPGLGENHKFLIGNIHVSDSIGLDRVYDKEQYISIEKPFYLLHEDIEQQEIEIKNSQIIPIGIDLDSINGINPDTINIDENIPIALNITQKGGAIGSRNKSFQVQIEPIKQPAKRNVYFETCDGHEFRISNKAKVRTSISFIEQPEDVVATKLGNILIRNISTIPYIDFFLKFTIANLSVKCNGENIIHKESLGYINKEIIIYNGGADYVLPLFIDYQLLKKSADQGQLSVSFKIVSFKDKDIIESTYAFDIDLIHQFVNDVYSLDLGTTGIVVAKEFEGIQEIVTLSDNADDPIEKEKEIISSHSMLIAKEKSEDGNSEIVLSPSGNEYYGITKKRRFRLVPSKFIIGQEKIPYLNDFYTDSSLNKNTRLFNLEGCEIDLSYPPNQNNSDSISTLIASLYKSIFSRFGQDTSKIKKLVITYPNTYTIENLDCIGDILRDELHLSLQGQVTFVPESDAVAAYYFDQIIMNKGGFFDDSNSPKEVENVIIYDMGAGTLDLSLISFKQNNSDGSITASIINKIGIPLAGNYLDYVICKTLVDSKIITEDLTSKHNTIKELSIGIKQDYQANQKIKEQSPNWYKENSNQLAIDNQTYSDIFEESLKGFLETCSKTVLELLIPKGTIVDTIVFSGRASKFATLRNQVKASLSELMGGKTINEDELLPTANCGDHLKTCVAIGALKYQSFFNNNDSFKIENKNLYSKIAVVYWGKKNGRFGVNVKFLIDPQSEQWDNAEFINGTWCKEFSANETISDHLSGGNKYLYYIQTCLDESRLQVLFRKVYTNENTQNDDLNWAFVNILYKIPINDSKPINVSLKISKDNKIIERRIGSLLLKDAKLLENVDTNVLYRRSMWPFITTLNQ